MVPVKPHEGWIGVDLDRTLAHYDQYRGLNHIGEPIPAMVERVKAWLAEGRDVRIFTARIAQSNYRQTPEAIFETIEAIEQWCIRHLGRALKVTCIKDAHMEQLWDDRAVAVYPNKGVPLDQPDWTFVSNTLVECRKRLEVDGVRHTWLDPAIDIARYRAAGAR